MDLRPGVVRVETRPSEFACRDAATGSRVSKRAKASRMFSRRRCSLWMCVGRFLLLLLLVEVLEAVVEVVEDDDEDEVLVVDEMDARAPG